MTNIEQKAVNGMERILKEQAKVNVLRPVREAPDPLVDAMAECGVDPFESWADQLRAALAKRGLEIREKSDANPQV